MIAGLQDLITPRDREIAALFERMRTVCVEGIRVHQTAEAMADSGEPVDMRAVCAVLAAYDRETEQLEARLHELIPGYPITPGGT